MKQHQFQAICLKCCHYLSWSNFSEFLLRDSKEFVKTLSGYNIGLLEGKFLSRLRWNPPWIWLRLLPKMSQNKWITKGQFTFKLLLYSAIEKFVLSFVCHRIAKIYLYIKQILFLLFLNTVEHGRSLLCDLEQNKWLSGKLTAKHQAWMTFNQVLKK